MYLIIWTYQVKAERAAEFEGIYAADGAWDQLFKKAKGFLETELLRDGTDARHYMTIDRWASLADHERFQSEWKTEYAELDAQCEDLTEQETLLGMWETVPSQTR